MAGKKRLIGRLFSHGLRCVIGEHVPFYAVGMTLAVEDEPGRYVDVHLTPEDAEQLGRGLIEYASKVRAIHDGTPAKDVVMKGVKV